MKKVLVTLALASAAAGLAFAAQQAAPGAKGREGGNPCAGKLEIVQFDRDRSQIELKSEDGEIQWLRVDERSAPGWRTYFKVGQKVSLTCKSVPESGSFQITEIRAVESK